MSVCAYIEISNKQTYEFIYKYTAGLKSEEDGVGVHKVNQQPIILFKIPLLNDRK